MRPSLPALPRSKIDRALLGLWAALALLFLAGLLFADLSGWRYRAFAWWLAFLVLFVGPSATLYLRVKEGHHVAVAVLSTVLGIALFLVLVAFLPVREATSEDGFVEVTWAGESFLSGSHQTYAKSEFLFFVRDVELDDPICHCFTVNPVFFLP